MPLPRPRSWHCRIVRPCSPAARHPAGAQRKGRAGEIGQELLFWARILPVEETELAGKLVRHTGKLKTVVDVIRIVCANAEAELAAIVAPYMRRPREAKKLVASLFAAPGKVAVTEHAIHVRLAPAANQSELVAIQHLLRHLNQRGLVLPSDPKRLPLRFEAQVR